MHLHPGSRIRDHSDPNGLFNAREEERADFTSRPKKYVQHGSMYEVVYSYLENGNFIINSSFLFIN